MSDNTAPLRKQKPKKGKGAKKGGAAQIKSRGASAAESEESKRHSSHGEGDEPHSDDEVNSEVSHLSLDDDLASVMGEHTDDLDDLDEETTESLEKIIENTLSEHLDLATHKNSSTRIKAMKSIQSLLSRYHIPDILIKWKATLNDVIEKSLSLRKGSTNEAIVGLKLAGLMAVQLGMECSDLVEGLSQTIRTHLTDESLNVDLRGECALVLAVVIFLTVDEIEPIMQSLDSLRKVWSACKPGAHNQPDQVPLFCHAVSSWGFLLARAPRRRQEEALNTDLPKVCAYLQNDQVDIRVSAGECLALLYQLGNDLNSGEFFPPNHQQTIDVLQELSTDSLKYRAKKDRRTQRSNFRQIFWAVKDGDTPDLKVKFSDETMELDTWLRKFCYDILCAVLRGGMNAHLKRDDSNESIRDVFDLAPVEKLHPRDRKLSKLQEKTANSIASKSRTLVRGRQRDKRTQDFSGE